MSSKSTHPLCSTQATSTYPPTAADFVHRKVLRQSVAAICRQAGFEMIEANVLELLTHMMCSYLLEVGLMTRQFTELAGRTQSTPNDIIMALIDCGTSVMELPDFLTKCLSQGSLVIAPPKQQAPPTTANPLRVGSARPHHPHIPDSLPPFPDPHTYIRTEISGDPELTYEKVREASAELKRNSEVSLRDFLLRTHPSTSVFSAFEQRIRREAQQLLEESKRQQKARLMARQTQRETERFNEELKRSQDEEMPEVLETSTEQKDQTKSEEDGLDNGHISDILSESLFVLEESENSLLRRRLPAICQIIEPSLNNNAYLAALICDEMNDECNEPTPPSPTSTSHSHSHSHSHSNHPDSGTATTNGNAQSSDNGNNTNTGTAATNTASGAPGGGGGGGSTMNGEETSIDENPYLRATRLPQHHNGSVNEKMEL